MRTFTSPRGLWLSLLALSLFALAPAARADAPKSREFIDGVPDTGQFLPNGTVLARVGDRLTRVLDFRELYFLSDAPIRPKGDSLGRAEFLTNMVRKDVLGLTALASGYTLNFEDRATLRETRTTALSNRLFETEVLGVKPVSDDSLRKVYAYYSYDQRMRMLFFTDRAKAEAVRAALLKGKTTWAAQQALFIPPALAATKGEIPWSRFENLPTELGLQLWALRPGGISEVIQSATGYQLVQVAERRPRAAPAFDILKPAIQTALTTVASEKRRLEITAEAKQGLNVRYDTTNVNWAAQHYSVAVQVGSESVGQNIVIDENVPDFAPADTARTILEWDGGRISLGRLAHAYSDLPPVMRPPINTPERFMDYADALMLEPRMVDLAIARGFEKDSIVVRKIERKREEILVTKMVEDSVLTRVMVTPQERRAYYEKNRNGFVTWPKVTYAVVVRNTRAAADSVKARLAAGETIGAILHADSLRGELRSGIQEATGEKRGAFEKILFEEMRPGQSQVMGPDAQKNFACIVLLTFDPGQQLAYADVEGVIDESVRNMKAEEALNAFVGRLMKRYPIETHYELLMRIKLVTPAADETY